MADDPTPEPAPRPDRCETCRFWKRAEDDPPSDEGWCQRHAPSPLIVLDSVELGIASSPVVWPFTDADDWCGEWQSKKVDGAKASVSPMSAKELAESAEATLSARARGVLARATREQLIDSFTDLGRLKTDELKITKGCGPMTYREIISWLRSVGFEGLI